jgi:hypothetical protein
MPFESVFCDTDAVDECGLLGGTAGSAYAGGSRQSAGDGVAAKRREKVSVIGAVGVSPNRSCLSLYFRTYPKQYIKNINVARFLRDLLRQVPARFHCIQRRRIDEPAAALSL